MAPVIHCVRHAQGYHNLCVENRSLPDAVITPLGEQQCLDLASSFEWHSRISLIIASPLTRTLQTAFFAFGEALSNGHCSQTVIAIPEVQEVSDLTADTGSDPAILTEICRKNGWSVDLTSVRDGWNDKKSPRWVPTYEAITKRAREARVLIVERVRQLQSEGIVSPEIVLVTHGGFLNYFTEDWEDSGIDLAYQQGMTSDVNWGMPGTGWKNTEVRSYYIQDGHYAVDSNPQLIETPESLLKRGKAVHDQRMGKISLDVIRKRSRSTNIMKAELPRSHI